MVKRIKLPGELLLPPSSSLSTIPLCGHDTGIPNRSPSRGHLTGDTQHTVLFVVQGGAGVPDAVLGAVREPDLRGLFDDDGRARGSGTCATRRTAQTARDGRACSPWYGIRDWNDNWASVPEGGHVRYVVDAMADIHGQAARDGVHRQLRPSLLASRLVRGGIVGRLHLPSACARLTSRSTSRLAATYVPNIAPSMHGVSVRIFG